MLYHLLPGLSDLNTVFNVFVYITFRAAGAVVTSLLIAFAFGPFLIKKLRAAGVGQVVVTHMAPSITDDEMAGHYKDEIARTFDGQIVIANDLDSF